MISFSLSFLFLLDLIFILFIDCFYFAKKNDYFFSFHPSTLNWLEIELLS